MKNNQPVTQREIDYSEDINILSTTNPKGSVSYVNDDFIDLSGFSCEELLHKNHNVVRHPDMPPAAFQNLWDTIKERHPWMGIVKNRTKDGDHLIPEKGDLGSFSTGFRQYADDQVIGFLFQVPGCIN